ncbi:hypothetical protein HJC23_000206 [Cyclotella cryptica]|uniref:Uncharacterized protein n=1 Tax=Cyclotella cryptica TaxID=29204 RepID=A0ABD3QDX1_9STRA
MTTVDDNITVQFNQLIRERDEFKHAAGIAERERRREEQVLQGHRSTMHEVADQIRVAQSDDGEGTRKLQTLKEIKARLAHQTESDRHEVVKVTNEMKGKEAEDKKQKWKFVREMDSINDELDVLLAKEENEKSLRLLDADTVNWLVEKKIAALIDRLEGMDENYVQAESEKLLHIKTKIEAARTALVEAQQKSTAVDHERKELELMLQGFRDQFMVENGVSSENDFVGFIFDFVPTRFLNMFFKEYW